MDADKNARELQDAVRHTEMSSRVQYEDDRVRQAVVHAREDIILVVSHLSSAARLLASIKALLVIIAVAAVVSAVALVWPLLV